MMDKDTQLTKNFKYSEFFCQGIQPPQEYEENIKRVAVELQKLRDYYNKPIIVTSGWRTKKHNSEVGGAINSFHLKGLAADVTPPKGISIKEFYQKAREITNFRGFGIGAKFLHLDLREKFTVWHY